jgi:hypothetical protein
MSICSKRPTADDRLLKPPDVLRDIAQFWGAIFNVLMPINWFVSFALQAATSTTASE